MIGMVEGWFLLNRWLAHAKLAIELKVKPILGTAFANPATGEAL
jgi:hypothetical protein